MNIQYPKNVQQIGESPSDKKVYMEDYVITFLEQVKKKGGQAGTVILLYGKKEQDGNQTCYFVYGASVKEEAEDPEKQKSVFPAYQILGEAVICREGEEPQKRIGDYGCISGVESILFLVGDGYDNQAVVISAQNARRLGGYYIFYDKNEMMQTLLLEWYRRNAADEARPERDYAVHEFRERYGTKQEEVLRRKMMRGLYAASLLLVMLCCITGISMMNQYEKMMQMQDTIDHLVVTLNEKELPEAQPAFSGSVITIGTPQEAETVREPSGEAADAIASPDNREEAGTSTASREEDQASVASREEAGTSVSDREGQTSGAVQEEQHTSGEGQGEAQEIGTNREETRPSDQEQAQETGTNRDEAQTAAEESATSHETVYIVQKGDTLAEISQTYYGTVKKVRQICEANQIQEPDKIRIGQKILLP